MPSIEKMRNKDAVGIDSDPNAAVLDAIARDLTSFTDARGRRLTVRRIPSPGPIRHHGEIVPASYLNFYIGNRVVAVPTYGVPEDQRAVDAIASCFPGRRTLDIRWNTLLGEGGGAVHCITQQVPAARSDGGGV